MYAKIPEHLKTPLLQELRRTRLKSASKMFPIVVVFLAALLAFVLWIKGALILRLLNDFFEVAISNRTMLALAAGLVVLIAMIFAAFFSWQQYRECVYQLYLYCSDCDAVDKYDDGHCPICDRSLSERADFFYTTDKEEKKILERWDLRACKEAAPATRTEKA